MACAWLTIAGDAPPALPRALQGRVPERTWEQVAELARTGVASPLTTSMGRLFDGVAALCGLRPEVSYEGQAAIELEAACEETSLAPYPLPLEGGGFEGGGFEGGGFEGGGFEGGGELLVLDPRPTIAAVAADIESGASVGSVATRFHAAVAGATVAACARAAAEHGVERVVLSGGVFQNRRLLSETAAGLAAAGLQVLIPERLPCNDGGIAYGQDAVAAWRMAHS
jgi:hydrogenase maturation protein HypF